MISRDDIVYLFLADFDQENPDLVENYHDALNQQENISEVV